MMTVFTQLESFTAWRRLVNQPVGFVPTMGALHLGHKALLDQSLQENPITVLSIFVNPTQFNQPEDFERYPKDLSKDLGKLWDWGLRNVVVLAPWDVSQLYPDGYRFKVTESPVSEKLCGAFRPGHFTGVLTIVMKLFWHVLPTKAYFGLKDYQQFRLIQDMVTAFGIPTQIVGVETVRSEEGLALSSRLERLSATELELAKQIYPLLKRSPDCETFRQEASRLGLRVEYCEDWENRRLVAVWVGSVRLIDNIPLKPTSF